MVGKDRQGHNRQQFGSIARIGTHKSASGYQFLGLFLTTVDPAPGRCDHLTVS